MRAATTKERPSFPMLGEDNEPQGSDEYMISLTADVGTDFIGFWK